MQYFDIVEGPNGDPLAALREQSVAMSRLPNDVFPEATDSFQSISQIFNHLAQINEEPTVDGPQQPFLNGTMVFNSLEDALKFLSGN